MQLTQERLRIVFFLKAPNLVISIPHDDNIVRGLPLAPLVDSEIQTIVEIEAYLDFKCQNVGCADLLAGIDQRSLKAHIFGYIHEG